MIEDQFMNRSVYEEALADGCVPTFDWSWGEVADD